MIIIPKAVQLAMEDFIAHRKEMKKPMTPRAKELFTKLIEKKLRALHTERELIDSIEEAILAGWQMIYPRPLSYTQQRQRWLESPELFYHYFDAKERTLLHQQFTS